MARVQLSLMEKMRNQHIELLQGMRLLLRRYLYFLTININETEKKIIIKVVVDKPF